jgi:hypothetical protein
MPRVLASRLVRRTVTVTMSVLALSMTGSAALADGPPKLEECYIVQVDSPTTGLHPGVMVCRPV